jgi:hypothetical protein
MASTTAARVGGGAVVGDRLRAHMRHDVVAQVAPYVVASVFVASLASFILRIPLQVDDHLWRLLLIQSSTIREVFQAQFQQAGYFRPLEQLTGKILFDLASGQYFAVFKTFQIAEVAVLLAIFVSLLRPRTFSDVPLVALAISVLVGSHTFINTIREMTPTSPHLSGTLACAAACALALGDRPRGLRDLTGVVLFLAAVLTIEAGLLVAVVYVAARLCGARGVSDRAIAVTTILAFTYLVVRLIVLDTGVPARDSGFGFSRLGPHEIQAQFGQFPAMFYAYNVVTSIAGVLFAEPRSGIFELGRAIRDGVVPAWMIINVVASTCGTLLIGAYVWSRRDSWRRWSLDRDDRVLFLFAAILVGNAALSFLYTKDVIMAPAGVLYAAALFVAVRRLPERPGLSRSLIGVVLVAASIAWSARAMGTHVVLRETALAKRNGWVPSVGALAPPSSDERARGLVTKLRRDALETLVPSSLTSWPPQLVDRGY